MTSTRPTRPPPWRARVLIVLCVVLFVCTGLYRFNTLGGALGGFDNDHFVPFAYVKQVEAGEQPLRDFAGVGLQGVWPSLTFELSSWAQRLLGDTLRSEALLSVFGLGLAAVLTLLASAQVSPIPVALGMSTLSVLLEPKLYSYPKVLVLAAAASLAGWYARTPGRRIIAVWAVLTAVSFLFRHDLAVFVGAGALTAIAGAAGSVRRAASHLLVYGAVTLTCLAPSLWFVHQHGGVRAYVEDSLFAIKEESRRTSRIERGVALVDEEGRRLSPPTFFTEPQNAAWWLYYANAALPLVVLAAIAARSGGPAGVRPALAATAVMALLVVPSFLRGNTAARVSDMAPLTAVLLAGGLAVILRGARWRPRDAAVAALAMAGLVVTVQSVWTIGNARGELDVSGFSDSGGKVVRQAARRWQELGALPAAYWSGEADRPTLRAVQYLHACTAPTDRVIVLSYQPELLPLADRRFGGGGIGMVPGLLFLYRNQGAMIARWRHEPVPIVLVPTGAEDELEIPFIFEYLRARYRDAGVIELDRGPMRVFVDEGRQPVGTFGATGLPCFQ